MKKKQNLLLLLSLFLFLVLLIINFSAERVTGKAPDCKVKRGYIFDRNLNPIAVSLEKYRAYYFIKNTSSLSHADLEILKKYLGSTLNLSKKGIIHLSDDLSLEEVERLKNKKNILIEETFERKVLQPYLKFLIGETFNKIGVSGLEKTFNAHLSEGKPLILSLDLNLEKKIYNIIYNLKLSAFEIAVFDLETGELLSYLKSENSRLFDNYYPLNFFGIPSSEVRDLDWALGKNPVLKEENIPKINAWHVAQWYMDKICKGLIKPTILFTKNKACQPELKISKEKYIYTLGDKFITIAFKENKMILASFAFNSTEAYALNRKLINYLYSQI